MKESYLSRQLDDAQIVEVVHQIQCSLSLLARALGMCWRSWGYPSATPLSDWCSDLTQFFKEIKMRQMNCQITLIMA